MLWGTTNTSTAACKARSWRVQAPLVELGDVGWEGWQRALSGASAATFLKLQTYVWQCSPKTGRPDAGYLAGAVFSKGWWRWVQAADALNREGEWARCRECLGAEATLAGCMATVRPCKAPLLLGKPDPNSFS